MQKNDFDKNEKLKKQKIKSNRKKQEKIKKQKIKEIKKKQKEIEKQQKIENKKRKKEIKKIEKYQQKRREQEIKNNVGTKKSKKLRRKMKAFKNFLILILIIFGIILFLISPVFNIRKIEVIGNSKVSSDTIKSLLQINNSTNIFSLSYTTIGQRIKQNSYIKSVKVNRVLPDTIKLTVTEREPSYQLEFGSSFVLIDDDGYILEILKEQKEGLVKIRGYATSEEMIIPGNRLCQSDLNRLKDVSEIIRIANNYQLANIITTVILDDNDEYSLYIETEKKTVHLGKNVDFETKLLYTKEILLRTSGEEGEIFVNMNLNEKNPYFRLKT